jgi:hypothetical protein
VSYTAAFKQLLGKEISTGEDYVLSGYSYVDYHCERFFVELEVEKRKLLFGKSTVAQAFTTAATIVPLVHDKTTDVKKPLAILAALAGLTNVMFEQYEKQFIFAPYSTQLRLKVQDAQHIYKQRQEEKVVMLRQNMRDQKVADIYRAH